MRRASAAGLAFGIAAGGLASAQAEVLISSAATENMSCSSGVCMPTAQNAVLNVDDLTGMLASGNVSVNTGSGSLGAEVANIHVKHPFSWASANSLTLDAYQSIDIEKSISVAGTAAVSLIINDGGSGGSLRFGPKGRLSFLGTTNALTINGNAYTLVNSVSALAAAIVADPSGTYALSTSYNARHDRAYNTAVIATTFEGSFNGLGNTISHLRINGKVENLVLGLFADIDTPASVSSIRVADTSITAKGNSTVGLLAAVNAGTVFNASSAGTLTATAGNEEGIAGGLVGINHGTLQATSSATNVTAKSQSSSFAYVGGLVAQNFGTIGLSYASGFALASSVSVVDSGGLVGFNDGTIANCYATGAASAGGESGAGGLVGWSSITISDSYSTGAPTANGAYVGGSVGVDVSSGGISNDYWDTDTSGITNLSDGAGNISNDPGISGETTAQLDAGLPGGFDSTIWGEKPKFNGGLPYLIANPPQ